MLLKKEINRDKFLENFYIGIALLFIGTNIFEVPGSVFYTPLMLFGAFVTYSLYSKRQIEYDIGLFILLIFTGVFSYFSYKADTGLYYQSYIYIHALVMYIIGYNFFNNKPVEERHRLLEDLFLFIAFAYVIYTVITIVNYYYNTDVDLPNRFFYSIWYHSVTKPSTVLSLCFVFPVSYGVYSLFYAKLPRKIIGIIFIAIMLYVNIKTGTRTLVFLFPVFLAAEFLAWLIFKKKKVKIGIALTAVCVLLGVAVIFLWLKYKDVIAHKYSYSNISRFFIFSESTQLRISYCTNVLKDFSIFYMGGGEHTLTFGTPHNIWLYLYDWGGFISLVIFSAFTIYMIVCYVKILKSKALTLELKLLLSSVLFIIFVEFMMEPFIRPLPSLYILCMFVFGFCSSAAKVKCETDGQLTQLISNNE